MPKEDVTVQIAQPKYGDQPTGQGFRPSFHALWHLSELCVVDDLDGFGSDAWEAAAECPTRVVIIDTLVDYRHPNIEAAIDHGLMRDFGSRDLGRFLVPPRPESKYNDTTRDELCHLIAGKDNAVARAIRKEIEAEMHAARGAQGGEGCTPPSGARADQPAAGIAFGSHGTAVAGLIGARPSLVKFRLPALYRGRKSCDDCDTDFSASKDTCLELPYAGINPFCKIVPVSITAAPRPQMIARALQYARMIAPDVVVIADSWRSPDSIEDCNCAYYGDANQGADPEGNREEAASRHDKKAWMPKPICHAHSPCEACKERWAWWKVDARLKALCRKAKVFCAAGNEDTAKLVYPASRCTKRRGPWAVGACDAHGDDLSYSPNHAEALERCEWMIKTLSTEVPRFDRQQTVVDPFAIKDEDQVGLPEQSTCGKEYPVRDIVTTDLPGRAGYNPSPYDHLPDEHEPYYEIASLFCRFAGTSAAAAIAGGLASLVPKGKSKKFKRKRKKPADYIDTGVPFDWAQARAFFSKR
ncbi:hypothetical protein KUV47_13840 [Vannielia litorea]|uniref:S8 family serine peptidase n=1 Tax=Vannielia litorea TaxID=1217970 RepID=UPI001C97A0A9|nr:S8 family serine peptidase [Vannielia litorea]MBY6154298.1 hypothetical protein [Vannielia litorea]